MRDDPVERPRFVVNEPVLLLFLRLGPVAPLFPLLHHRLITAPLNTSTTATATMTTLVVARTETKPTRHKYAMPSAILLPQHQGALDVEISNNAHNF